MIPLKCPTCGLQWNIREDSPASVTCPRCLAPVVNPDESMEQRKRPLPVLLVEDDVNRDTSTSRIGLTMVIIVVGIGLAFFFMAVAGSIPGKVAMMFACLLFCA